MTGHQSIPGLRLLPVNRIASIKLRGAGVAENERMQPVFQLMAWGIDCHRLRRYRDLSREFAALVSGDQEQALYYLLENVPGGPGVLMKSLLEAEPRAAAGILLAVLDMRLKAVPHT